MLSRIFLSLVLALPALTTLSRAIMCPASADTSEQASGAMCAPAPDACCCGPADPAGDSCGCAMDSAAKRDEPVYAARVAPCAPRDAWRLANLVTSFARAVRADPIAP